MDAGEFEIDLTGYGEKEFDKLLAQFHIPGEVTEDNFDADAEIIALLQSGAF